MLLPVLGVFVDVRPAANGRPAMQCPICCHWTPDIPSEALTPDRFNQSTAWIVCGCQTGTGEHTTLRGRVADCPCVATWRVLPSGTSGRYILRGHRSQNVRLAVPPPIAPAPPAPRKDRSRHG